MLENANETYDPAPENRKQVQSQGNFEPLLDTEEAARLLRMHPPEISPCSKVNVRGSTPLTG
jgi:hypothetical protein